MQLKINNKVFDKYTSCSVSLHFDTVASTFSFDIYFDPSNPEHRKTFLPGAYNICEVSHNGEVLITGVGLNQAMRSGATKQLIKYGGYSRTGSLNDCQKPVGYSTQYIGKPISDIAKQLIAPFGLELIIDPAVESDANAVYQQTSSSPAIDPDQTVIDFLTTLALGRNLIFSHTPQGNLLLTRGNTKQAPAFGITNGAPCIGKELIFDGQRLHNKIWAVGEANGYSANTSQSDILNPYVQSKSVTSKLGYIGGLPTLSYETGYRPGVYVQRSGNDNSTKLTARQYLAQELKDIRFSIEIEGWEVNGKLVRPNTIITVQDAEIFLYQKTRLFVESVTFTYKNPARTAVLSCVVPECYNNEDVINVFTGSNLTVPFEGNFPIHGD